MGILRRPVSLAQERRRGGEVDDQGDAIHRWTCLGGSVAGDGRVHERRPRLDAPDQVVDIPEPVMLEVFGGLLTANAVVALKHERRVAIAEEQLIVILPVQQARPIDVRQRPLLFGAHVDQLDGGAAPEPSFEIGSRICRIVGGSAAGARSSTADSGSAAPIAVKSSAAQRSTRDVLWRPIPFTAFGHHR